MSWNDEDTFERDDWSAWADEEASRWAADMEAAAAARAAEQQRLHHRLIARMWRGDSREGTPEPQMMEDLLDQEEQAAEEVADDLEEGRFAPLRLNASSRSASPVPPAALQAGFDMAINEDYQEQEVKDYLEHDVREEVAAAAADAPAPEADQSGPSGSPNSWLYINEDYQEQEVMDYLERDVQEEVAAAAADAPVVYERREYTRYIPETDGQYTAADYPPVNTRQRVESHLRPGVFTDLVLTPKALRSFIQNQTDPALVASMFGVEAPTGKRTRVRRQDIVESVPIRQPSRAASVSSSASESPAPRRPGKGVVLPRASMEEVMARECANGCLRVTGNPKMYVCVPNDDNTPIKDITQYVNLGRQVATTKHPCEFDSFDAYKSDPKIKAMSSTKRWKAPKWNQYCCH